MKYSRILEYLGLEGIVEGFPYFTIVSTFSRVPHNYCRYAQRYKAFEESGRSQFRKH